MCGFVVHLSDKQPNEKYVMRRGPDWKQKISIHGFTFIHYLLHITGEFTPQPYMEDDIVCVFNGEIYNFNYKKSDGENLIPLYKEYGVLFPKYLDGEFAIALYDFARKRAIFSTDAFGTKPLYVNGLESASYQSCLGGDEIPPNTILVRSFFMEDQMNKTKTFDFGNQYKKTYDNWIFAFKNAVQKRAKKNCFIGLSSGYDSGAIVCEMKKQNVKFKAYGIQGSENVSLMKQRLAEVNGQYVPCSEEQYLYWKSFIKEYAEEYNYEDVPNGPVHCKLMTDDWGAVGSAILYNHARSENLKVCLCGQGADEILSDYSLYPTVSTLNGIFPKELQPWPNFFGGCQRAYLRKEEYIAGCFGIESRYPFLDNDLVQEFLWLDNEYKNVVYKAPLDWYLTINKYSFIKNTKVGFSGI